MNYLFFVQEYFKIEFHASGRHFLKSSAPHTICKERRSSDWNLRNFNLKRPLETSNSSFGNDCFFIQMAHDAHLQKWLSPGTSTIEEKSHPLFRSITRQMASTTSAEASISIEEDDFEQKPGAFTTSLARTVFYDPRGTFSIRLGKVHQQSKCSSSLIL